MSANGEVCRNGDFDLACEKVGHGFVGVGLGSEKISYNDGEREVVLGMEGGELAKS